MGRRNCPLCVQIIVFCSIFHFFECKSFLVAKAATVINMNLQILVLGILLGSLLFLHLLDEPFLLELLVRSGTFFIVQVLAIKLGCAREVPSLCGVVVVDSFTSSLHLFKL